MPTVKTAISIDEALDKKIKKMSKKLNISKSQIFSQAVQFFIERDENLELLEKINRAHSDVLENPDFQKEKTLYSRTIEKW